MIKTVYPVLPLRKYIIKGFSSGGPGAGIEHHPHGRRQTSLLVHSTPRNIITIFIDDELLHVGVEGVDGGQVVPVSEFLEARLHIALHVLRQTDLLQLGSKYFLGLISIREKMVIRVGNKR